ncbi:hypothetical protein GCM10012287_10160 [Streptomyces daqingensis]|uniref:GHMP kinase C-terminal domain-containing protein n=1 Tax=Streptomyces daqingensis TaxID=1472640 RepID=A0ABQ2LXP5_9ACTN|nr:hypothetical protein [Streptomyces daqingensis]GGO44470.1 hypothetical protein GCM10012287_10160 [Streptomyces daqingensis]
MLEICHDVGGLGLAVGHSGTTLGILLDSRDSSCTRKAMEAAQACGELAGNVAVYRTLSFPGAAAPTGSHAEILLPA